MSLEFYSVPEIAKKLKVGETTIWKHIREGRLKCTRITSKCTRIREDWFIDFTENGIDQCGGQLKKLACEAAEEIANRALGRLQ